MTLKRDIIDHMKNEKFCSFASQKMCSIFTVAIKIITKNGLKKLPIKDGWIIALNMPESTIWFQEKKLNYYIELMEIINWRIYKPEHLFQRINTELSRRLE